jgi:hypothetical protein
MSLPSASDPVWKKIISEEKKVSFEFMGIKVFMGKVKSTLASDPGKADDLVKELHDLFTRNESHPMVKRDIEKING